MEQRKFVEFSCVSENRYSIEIHRKEINHESDLDLNCDFLMLDRVIFNILQTNKQVIKHPLFQVAGIEMSVSLDTKILDNTLSCGELRL